MTKRERLEELKNQVAAYRARYGEGSCYGPMPGRNGHAYVYYYDFTPRFIGDGEREADAAEEYDLDAGLWRYSDTAPDGPQDWEGGEWGGWQEMPAGNGREHMLRRTRRMVETRRKAFGPGSTGDPVLSDGGRTCTVVFYNVDRVHPGEGDHGRWSLAWVRNVHPAEAASELQVDLDGGRSRERLLDAGAGGWSEWHEEGGPDGRLGAYHTDEEITAAAWDVVAHEDDPATAPLEKYLHGEAWLDDDVYLLRAAALEIWTRTRNA